MFDRGLLSKLRRRLYFESRRLRSRYFKNFRLDDHLREIHENVDPKSNYRTTPPEDELVDLVSLWAVEFYTPAHIDGLMASFAKLGWSRDSVGGRSSDPMGWLEELRHSHHGGAWLNLGRIVPSKSNRFVGGIQREVSLPQNVEYADAGLFSLTPSLICIVVCFVFDRSYSDVFDKALRVDRFTFATPTKTGWRFHTPENQKTSHIQQCRQDLVRIVFDWYSEHLPGLFCSGLLNGEMPTCELVTTRKEEPFDSASEKEQYPPGGFRRVLGIGRDFRVWKFKDDPSLKLKLPSGEREGPQHHAILATMESPFEYSQDNESTNQGVRDGLYGLNKTISDWLSVWAITPLLEGYTRRIREFRDSASLRPKKRQNSLEALEVLGRHVSFVIDVSAVVAELAPESETPMYLFHLSGQFEPCNTRLDGELSLASSLNRAITDRARWLRRTEVSLRDQMTQYGSILGAVENVRVQRKIGWLTWVLVIFGVASLIVSFVALTEPPWFDDFLSYLKFR